MLGQLEPPGAKYVNKNKIAIQHAASHEEKKSCVFIVDYTKETTK